jgi:hypothetical protein
MNTAVKENSLWKHKNGNYYIVLLVANLSSTRIEEYPPTVVYKDANTGEVWSKPLSDWHRSRELLVNNLSMKANEN